jgi:hypothetical protein
MGDSVTMTTEQFQELLRAVKSNPAGPVQGLGRDMRVVGIGCGDGGMGPLATGVYEMLILGSPRLALARALGIRFAPYYMNIRGTFDDISVTDIPPTGSDVKIVQDTLIDEVCFTITNKSNSANQNVWQPQFDYYFNKQSGIEVTWDIQGAPRPTLVPKFTPLANVADGLLPFSRWPRGFVLSYTQQLEMAFRATVVLPFVPIEVCVTMQAWLPMSDLFVDMKNSEAFAGLASCGFVTDQSYQDRVCQLCR